MPRIPDTEIERIKQATDLAALVRSRGIELKKHGNGHLTGRARSTTMTSPALS